MSGMREGVVYHEETIRNMLSLYPLVDNRNVMMINVQCASYFARIALANCRNVKIEKEDYWMFFPFSTQVKIIEYLIINKGIAKRLDV